MGYTLIYFNLRGKAEAIRLILEDNGLEYENVKVVDWKNEKPKMAFGQVPCFRDGDFELVQTSAIIRYLARKHSLYGENDKEKAKIDMIHEGQEDLRTKYLLMIYHNYEAGKEDFIKELPKHLEKFEALLTQNNEGKGFFVGNKISYADYTVFDLLDNLLILAPTCLESFPTLSGFHKRISERKSISEYRSTDYFKSLNVNGNGKQ